MKSDKPIGRYHILERLGRGGMATVYKALDTRLERQVAIKVILKEAFPEEFHEHMLKRFDREAKALAKLQHPNIVKILDYGKHEGAPYLVMELLSGGTLKYFTGQAMPYCEAARLLAPVARALAYAHHQGILHRDVKPSNILITQSGIPILSDFGIAKLLESDQDQTLTGTNAGIGTPEYMAPEQCEGKEIDGRADLYSLGVILYELTTGRKPFTADTPLAVLLKQVNDPLPRPTDLISDFPEELDYILLKALAKDPDDRFENMASFASALESFSKDEFHPHSENIDIKNINDHLSADLPSDEFASTIYSTQTSSNNNEAIFNKNKLSENSKFRTNKLNKNRTVVFTSGLVIFAILISIFISWSSQNNQNTIASKTTVAVAYVQTAISNTKVAISPTPSSTTTSSPTDIPTFSPTFTQTDIPASGDIKRRDIDNMPMIFIPEGDFIMGSDNGELNERPAHTVFLDSFWIDQYEVTNQQFSVFVDQTQYITTAERNEYSHTVENNELKQINGQDWRHPTGEESNIVGKDNYPVVNVSWFDAKEYCLWAGGSLPTEAQWEKAARGVDERSYPWGNTAPDSQLANYNNNNDGPMEVGSFPAGASPYGAMDMAGNVWEWVSDWYSEDYYQTSSNINPMGPSMIFGEKVIRGGVWYNDRYFIRVVKRAMFKSRVPTDLFGFRCVTQ